MFNEFIEVRGACQHNLRNVDVDIPIHKFTVITGVSGSGKSTLALDVLYAEGQRRYVESFSAYTRQFLERMPKPQVEHIGGIPPAIAIDQKRPVKTSRSTVGTMTEISDHLKLLFAKTATPTCRNCQKPIAQSTPETIAQIIGEGERVFVAFPFEVPGLPWREVESGLARAGFTRIVENRAVRGLDALLPPPPGSSLAILVDRIVHRRARRGRILASLEQAFHFGKGRLILIWPERPEAQSIFSARLECPNCGFTCRNPQPSLFSFNSPLGACETCKGFGRVIGLDLNLIIPEPRKSIDEGAIKPWSTEKTAWERRQLKSFCRRHGIPTSVPYARLSKRQKELIISGDDDFFGLSGWFEWLEGRTYKMHVRVFLSRYRGYHKCQQCGGTRFKPEALDYRLSGKTIAEINAMNVTDAARFFDSLELPRDSNREVAELVVREIRTRLHYLNEVGLGYLTLDRQSRTLSGGELERVDLTTAVGSALVNTLYVLDEPSIGLHPRDSRRLVEIIKRLCSIRNTVVVIEHDPEIIRAADHVIDLGPGAGEAGGKVVFSGRLPDLLSSSQSLTADYLSGRRRIPLPLKRRPPIGGLEITINGARTNNLCNIDVSIPLARMVCITGVSGSGKSSLIEETLYRAIKRRLGEVVPDPGPHGGIAGAEKIADIILVDQRPIGTTPRANPASFLKFLDPVRKLFASTTLSRLRGYSPGTFSFNSKGGRCPACKGEGFEKIEMQFLSDLYVPCPECGGKRYLSEVLEVRYRGKNIADVLDMTVVEARQFFSDHRAILRLTQPLLEVGLGYLKIGQPLNTLSAGEAQRLKLAGRLAKEGKAHTLFIFDEPTIGLHFSDIETLLGAFDRLVERGHSVLIIEHNMDVIKCADWVIDLGPEGGDEGGKVVATGTPEEIARCEGSHTGRFLRPYLESRLSSYLPLECDGRPLPLAAEGRRRVARNLPRRSKPSSPQANGSIKIRGAREHNLQALSVDLPRDRFITVTGLSGSGKSTLAFDIVFAEGQRRYMESLSTYVRQFMKVMSRPNVDSISGVPPTVAIEQRLSQAGRKSTVATITEIYHYLRLLYAKVGVQYCPACNRKIDCLSREQILARAATKLRGGSSFLLAPVVRGRKGQHREVLQTAARLGFRQARVDGRVIDLSHYKPLDRYKEHDIDIIVGRLKTGARKLAHEMILGALRIGGGVIKILSDSEENILSERLFCRNCNIGLDQLDPRLFSFNSRHGACPDCDGFGFHASDEASGNGARMAEPCPACRGTRLNPRARAVRVAGKAIWQLTQLSVDQALETIGSLKLNGRDARIASDVVREVLPRLEFLVRVGLGYLTLDRQGDTLSGGELQRIRLAAQLGADLRGACYILDEPTIGLHPRDNDRLLDTLKQLRDRGNTVIVVEHDQATIDSSDLVVDLGPGAGADGGVVVALGRPEDIRKNPNSVTGRFLARVQQRRRSRQDPRKLPRITVRGAREHNLKNITASFPLGAMTCVTGVSGSGKSTLVRDVLYQGLRALKGLQVEYVGKHRSITGAEAIARVAEVDQSPIGRTPRSVPASYIGILDDIRRLFALTTDARMKGFSPARFSFNVRGGRCESCAGQGQIRMEMSFLPEIYVACETCGGQRFNEDTLSVTYNGRTIAEVLAMTFNEAQAFFAPVPTIRHPVNLVTCIGLGYLTLGQPSNTLSGGEAQRIKLAAELGWQSRGPSLYVLDEPTTGLHFADIERLVDAFDRLVQAGNTLVVIEHNTDILREADWIIDLGPEGGDAGGSIVAMGTPAELGRLGSKPSASHTAVHLARSLHRHDLTAT